MGLTPHTGVRRTNGSLPKHREPRYHNIELGQILKFSKVLILLMLGDTFDHFPLSRYFFSILSLSNEIRSDIGST